MKTNLFVLIVCLFLLTSNASAGSYEDAIAKWKSYKDVASWLNNNFSFDKDRQMRIGMRLKKQGPASMVFRNPAKLYEKYATGYCADSANFAIKSLNRIDPSYNARAVFIWNERGHPNHWVTAFDLDNKLYIMDYGTGVKYEDMQGIHGPYTSLEEYRNFLTSLDLPGFKIGRVIFMDMPGKED